LIAVTDHVEMEAGPRPGELAVQSASQDGKLMVSVAGELDIVSAPELQEVLEAAQSSGAPNLVVDLAGLQFIDSTGLRVLLAAKRDADRGGGSLRILNPRAEVRRLLEIAGVLTLLSADGH
jgi:anti-sigma B factor antagonist